MDISDLTIFLGWSSIINIGLLLFSSLMLTACRNPIQKLHAKLFNISEESLPPIYIKVIAQYKILIIIFNVVPYFALRIMG